MEFAKNVTQDIILYTVPWSICRFIVYTIVYVNRTLQESYEKKQADDATPVTSGKKTKKSKSPLKKGQKAKNQAKKEEESPKDFYFLPKTFTFSEKLHQARIIFAASGVRGFFVDWKQYVLPYTTSRIAEGIAFFSAYRFFMEILQLQDVYFLLSYLAAALCALTGAFAGKLTSDWLTNKESHQLMAYLSPKNIHFWKQFEGFHFSEQVFNFFLVYFQFVAYWYFTPNLKLKIILYGISRILAVVTSAPFYKINDSAKEFNYNYPMTFKHLVKKFGYRGLFAGSFDACFVESVLSVIQVPMDYAFESVYVGSIFSLV